MQSTKAEVLKLFMTCACTVLLISCAEDEATTDRPEPAEEPPRSEVEVTARHDHAENLHLFDIDRTEIEPGWTTFRFTNASPDDHFFLIWQVPEDGVAAAEAAGEPLLEHWYQGVTVPFQDAFDPYIDGEIDYETFVDDLVASISEKAPWFFEPGVTPMGGPGLTAVGNISETTVHLEAEEYIVECYVRDEDDVFHSSIGMLEHLTVSGEPSGTGAPEPTANLHISTTDGIRVDRELGPGQHVVGIHFEDQTTYGNMGGHNVQLVKLTDKDDEALLADLSVWMDWREDGGLVDRAPRGAEFVGGTMDMTEGSTAYFHVQLEAGDYAWIAEIPDPAAHGMLKPFSVEP